MSEARRDTTRLSDTSLFSQYLSRCAMTRLCMSSDAGTCLPSPVICQSGVPNGSGHVLPCLPCHSVPRLVVSGGACRACLAGWISVRASRRTATPDHACRVSAVLALPCAPSLVCRVGHSCSRLAIPRHFLSASSFQGTTILAKYFRASSAVSVPVTSLSCASFRANRDQPALSMSSRTSLLAA